MMNNTMIKQSFLNILSTPFVRRLAHEVTLAPLLWLRQREVVHFNRFKELYEYYKSKGY